MLIRVHAHGDVRRYLGNRGSLEAEVPDGASVAAALRQLGVPDAEVWMVAVDGQQVGEDHPLRPGDELTIFAPVEGGTPDA